MLRLPILTHFRLLVTRGRRSLYLRRLHHETRSKTLIATSTSSPNSDHVVSFFRTSCGLSHSDALAAAAKTDLKTTANAESVVSFLKNYGFTKSHIAIIAAKEPAIFCLRSEKCIKPKIDLFVALGFSSTALANLITKHPSILKSSLKKRLSPNLHLLMNILSGDKDAAAASITSSAWILGLDPKKHILPNVETLRQHGVNNANIAKLLKWCPWAITHEAGRFSRSAALVQEMGLDSSKSTFILGIHVVSGLTRATWERKMKIYHSLGWSQEETISAFKKSPYCMLVSEEKIRKILGFFMKNLNWEPCRLASLPILLNFSLEKRIVPRYCVFNILTKRGSTKLGFSTLLFMSESDFLKKCVYKYSDEIPELLEAYKVKSEMTVLKMDL